MTLVIPPRVSRDRAIPLSSATVATVFRRCRGKEKLSLILVVLKASQKKMGLGMCFKAKGSSGTAGGSWWEHCQQAQVQGRKDKAHPLVNEKSRTL